MDRLTIEQRKSFLVEFLHIIDSEFETIFEEKRHLLNYREATRELLRHAGDAGPDHYVAKIIHILLDELQQITAQEYELVKSGLPTDILHPQETNPEPGYVLKD